VGDLALEWTGGAADLAIRDGDLASDEGLRTASLLSLFTDRRAENDDPLPGEDEDLRGWWGDEFLAVEGDRFGSRLWLLDRSKRTGDVIRRTDELVREAKAWMLEDRVTDRIDVEVETGATELLFAAVINRPASDPVTFRFAHVWEGESRQPTEPAQVIGVLLKSDSMSTVGFAFAGRGGRAPHGRGSPSRDLRTYLNQLGVLG
jgi:phage gp46-like protein